MPRLVRAVLRDGLALLGLALTVSSLALREARLIRAAETVRVIVPDEVNLQFLSFWVALSTDQFADEGVTIELRVPSNHRDAALMVLNDEAPAAVLPPPLYLELFARPVEWVLVANLLANDPINLVVRRSVAEARGLNPELPLADRIEKLAGLRIGVAPNPPARLRALFHSVGHDADREVTLVILRGDEQNRALAAGKVDALYAHTPYLERALVDQDAVMVVDQSGGEVPELAGRQIHALAVSRRLAEAKPSLVTSLVLAVARAQRLIHEHPERAVESLARRYPELDRRHLETIVAIYEPAVPNDPQVSPGGLAAALELFPSSRAVPKLPSSAWPRLVAGQFADQALATMNAVSPSTDR